MNPSSTPDVTVTASGGGAYCPTGTATVTASNATGTFSVSPSTGLSYTTNPTTLTINLAASTPNTYTVSFSYMDGTCQRTLSTTITIYALPTVYNVTGGGVDCSGGTGLAVGLSGSDIG